MVNYENGKIYKVVDNTNGSIYIGATCKPRLSSRLSQHKNAYKKFLDNKLKNTLVNDIIKNGNCSIFLITNYSCNTKDEIIARKQEIINELECINKNSIIDDN